MRIAKLILQLAQSKRKVSVRASMGAIPTCAQSAPCAITTTFCNTQKAMVVTVPTVVVASVTFAGKVFRCQRPIKECSGVQSASMTSAAPASRSLKTCKAH